MNILFGIFSLLFSLTVFAIYGGPLSAYRLMSSDLAGALLSATAIFHILLAVPCLIGGWYLRRFDERARSALIVTSALNLLNVPIGSLLGGYGIWVLLTEETEPLFLTPPPDRRVKRPVPTVPPQVSAIAEKQNPSPENSARTPIVPPARS